MRLKIWAQYFLSKTLPFYLHRSLGPKAQNSFKGNNSSSEFQILQV